MIEVFRPLIDFQLFTVDKKGKESIYSYGVSGRTETAAAKAIEANFY